MGMGATPCHGWIISQEQLESIVPNAWAELDQLLDDQGKDLSDLARCVHEEEPVCDSAGACEAIDAALQRLCDAFREATRVGESCLELELFYYCFESGSRNDDLEDDANWLVDGMQQLSPAGKQFLDRIQWKGWTVYG